MRFRQRRTVPVTQGDMTPMIDMVFQLIAFFMVVINFSEVDYNERIALPQSELAQPPEGPLPTMITLQVTREGTVILSGDEVLPEGLRTLLVRERQVLLARGEHRFREATIVIRADRAAETGRVQEVIQVCQETGFENFAVRARQEDRFVSVGPAAG